MVKEVGCCREEKIFAEDINTSAYEVCQAVKNILDILMMKYSINQDQCFDIKVILCELLQNAIKHGNECDLSKKIHLDMWMKAESKVLGITVKDQGYGFNAQQRKVDDSCVRECDPVSMDESGRGLYIVNELCDCMEFNSVGNAITVLKRL